MVLELQSAQSKCTVVFVTPSTLVSSTEEEMFSRLVCWFVCLSVCLSVNITTLYKKLSMSVHEIFGCSRPWTRNSLLDIGLVCILI